MRLAAVLVLGCFLLPLTHAFGAAYPGSFYHMVMKMHQPRDRKNARTAPSPSRLWAYREPASPGRQSAYYRVTSPPKTAEDQRRSDANNNKPSKLRYNSKTDGLSKRLGKPFANLGNSSVAVSHVTGATATEDAITERRQFTEAPSTTSFNSSATEHTTTVTQSQRWVERTGHGIPTTPSPHDVHKQNEFYKKYEKLQLDQIKAHKAYQRTRVELKQKHTQLLRDDPSLLDNLSGDSFLRRRYQTVKTELPTPSSSPYYPSHSSTLSNQKNNYRIPQSFINSEPKQVIRKEPYYRNASRKDSKPSKYHKVLPPYMYRYYHKVPNKIIHTSTETLSQTTPFTTDGTATHPTISSTVSHSTTTQQEYFPPPLSSVFPSQFSQPKLLPPLTSDNAVIPATTGNRLTTYEASFSPSDGVGISSGALHSPAPSPSRVSSPQSAGPAFSARSQGALRDTRSNTTQWSTDDDKACGGEATFQLDPHKFLDHPKQRAFHTIFSTPGYGLGQLYDEQLHCKWTVHIGDSCKYGMMVYALLPSRIRRSHSCNEDHLDVRYNGDQVARYCGPLSKQQKVTGAKIWSDIDPKNLTLIFESRRRPRGQLVKDKDWGVAVTVSAYCWEYSEEFKQQAADIKKMGKHDSTGPTSTTPTAAPPSGVTAASTASDDVSLPSTLMTTDASEAQPATTSAPTVATAATDEVTAAITEVFYITVSDPSIINSTTPGDDSSPDNDEGSITSGRKVTVTDSSQFMTNPSMSAVTEEIPSPQRYSGLNSLLVDGKNLSHSEINNQSNSESMNTNDSTTVIARTTDPTMLLTIPINEHIILIENSQLRLQSNLSSNDTMVSKYDINTDNIIHINENVTLPESETTETLATDIPEFTFQTEQFINESESHDDITFTSTTETQTSVTDDVVSQFTSSGPSSQSENNNSIVDVKTHGLNEKITSADVTTDITSVSTSTLEEFEQNTENTKPTDTNDVNKILIQNSSLITTENIPVIPQRNNIDSNKSTVLPNSTVHSPASSDDSFIAKYLNVPLAMFNSHRFRKFPW